MAAASKQPIFVFQALLEKVDSVHQQMYLFLTLPCVLRTWCLCSGLAEADHCLQEAQILYVEDSPSFGPSLSNCTFR